MGGLGREVAALPLITKTIPSTGEKLPVIGLGTNQYSVTAPEEIAARREVLKHFPELGAKVIDTARGYGEAEVVIGNLLKELGNRDKMFLATKTPIRGDILPAMASSKRRSSGCRRTSSTCCRSTTSTASMSCSRAARNGRRPGKVRYIGVTTSTDDQYPQIKDALNKLPLDFIQVDYSIDNRGAGDEILPLALEKGRRGADQRAARRPSRQRAVEDWRTSRCRHWAAEFDVTSWAQLLLKYNISHPAVTAVIPGTTKLTHLKDNQRAGRGRLPDGSRAQEDRGAVGRSVTLAKLAGQGRSLSVALNPLGMAALAHPCASRYSGSCPSEPECCARERARAAPALRT